MSRVHSPQAAHTHRAAGLAVLDLIERLEKAEAGSRELDAAMADAFGYPKTVLLGEEVLGNERWLTDKAPPVTTSLDAALALAERVLPGSLWCVARDDGFAPILRYRAWVATREEALANPLRSVGAPTPALALCIAVLRATTPAEADAVGTEPKAECSQ